MEMKKMRVMALGTLGLVVLAAMAFAVAAGVGTPLAAQTPTPTPTPCSGTTDLATPSEIADYGTQNLPSYPVTKAIDDNASWFGRWAAQAGDNTNYIILDFGSVKSINKVRLYQAYAMNFPDRALKDFVISVSTQSAGSGFTQIFSGTLPLINFHWNDFFFPSVDARYVRIDLTSNYGGRGISLCEIEIYETAECPTPPPGVGGIAELPEVSGSSGYNYVALAALAAGLLVALSAGGWYARRRWFR